MACTKIRSNLLIKPEKFKAPSLLTVWISAVEVRKGHSLRIYGTHRHLTEHSHIIFSPLVVHWTRKRMRGEKLSSCVRQARQVSR